jgi:hypothetical protein
MLIWLAVYKLVKCERCFCYKFEKLDALPKWEITVCEFEIGGSVSLVSCMI